MDARSRVTTHADYTLARHNNQHNNSNNMESKQNKTLPCHEERFDSGLESLKDDELVQDLEGMSVSEAADLTHECEPWRAALTEDGDT